MNAIAIDEHGLVGGWKRYGGRRKPFRSVYKNNVYVGVEDTETTKQQHTRVLSTVLYGVLTKEGEEDPDNDPFENVLLLGGSLSLQSIDTNYVVQ
jgi:hypothetical protein